MSTLSSELQTEITLQDLQLLSNLIDLAASKGILRAADLTVIGLVHDKISAVIKASKHEN